MRRKTGESLMRLIQRALRPVLFFCVLVPLAAQNPTPVSKSSPVQSGQEAELRFALLKDQVRPGEPLAAAISGLSPGETSLRAVLTTGDRRLGAAKFFPLPGDPPCWAVLLGVPSTAQAGPARLRIETGNSLLGELVLEITERSFAAEEIPLDQANTDIRIRENPQKTREAELLWSILNRSGTDVYSLGPFIPPLNSTRRTSFFGDRRVFIYTGGGRDSSIHGGVDYGVPTGTPVWACAGGRVVLARSRIVTGNSVVIEHLPGVYSLYYHLDRIAVSEGQILKAGESLGQSGATGLATGPHLHWEIRVAGENTDPDAFLAAPVIDREVILSKLGL
jgi:murein DD-endopeptidase MepM/ murein hydrolase activator NlpD